MTITPFIFDYTVWVFFSALGVLQIAAVNSGLHGLLFARRWPRASLLVSTLVIIAAFTWFFASEFRNLPDTTVGLDGNIQGRWFAISGAAAVVVTFLLSSAVNHRWGARGAQYPGEGPWPPSGLTWLERTTFARAVAARATALRGRRS